MTDPDLTTIRVQKRDGAIVVFDESKISQAVLKAFREVYKNTVSESDLRTRANRATIGTVGGILTLLKDEKSETINIESIQDLVEVALVIQTEHSVARAYISYRDARRKVRDQTQANLSDGDRQKIQQDLVYLPTQIQAYQFYSKFSRWQESSARRETFVESKDRTLKFFREELPTAASTLTEEEWKMLDDAILSMEAFPALRVLQMAGPALHRENLGCYNCAGLPIDSLFSFCELLYLLMQGCGVGFSIEEDFVRKLPGIRRQKLNVIPETHVIADSTEGWCDALHAGLKKWFSGEDILFDYSQIRPIGSRLYTKGGRASGPDPLRKLLTLTREKVLARQGHRLLGIDCLDICNKAGDIVHVGGVRRAAEICLFDADDEEVAKAKHGEFWLNNGHRSMSNNSRVFESKPTSAEFLTLWNDLAKSGTGEPGFFNRAAVLATLPKRRKKAKFITNPCGEISFRPRGLCNLTIAIARPTDTVTDLVRKVKIATYFGTLQSMLTKFQYVTPEWVKNAEEERLLGVDIMGQMDCPLLQIGAPNREELLEKLRNVVLETNASLAGRLRIPASAAATCVKPGGDSSVLFDASSSVLGRHSQFYIRRMRANANDPLTRLMIDSRVPWFPEAGQEPETCTVVVFEFPIKAPEGAITRHDLTCEQSLENWLLWKRHWAEHSVSCTIYVDTDEWMRTGSWVYDHLDEITGLSFLPKDGGLYDLMPLEDISESEYERRKNEFPELDFSKLSYYEREDHTTVTRNIACVGDKCTF